MPLALLSGPSAEPLHVAEVRQHLKQDATDDDNMIGIYLSAAREFAEAQTARQFVAAKYRLVLDSFPGPTLIGVPYGIPFGVPPHAIVLPRSPLIRVDSINYLDMAGAEQTVPADLYTVDGILDPARITPRFGRIWPIPLPQIASVWVDFWAGYIAPATADTTADTLAVDNWPALEAGAAVRLSNSGGALPAPLKPNRTYYVASVESEGVYKLAATVGGDAIDLTTTGTGTHYLGQANQAGNEGILPANIRAWLLLRADTHYAHRGETAVVRGTLERLPYADRLLDPFRTLEV